MQFVVNYLKAKARRRTENTTMNHHTLTEAEVEKLRERMRAAESHDQQGDHTTPSITKSDLKEMLTEVFAQGQALNASQSAFEEAFAQQHARNTLGSIGHDPRADEKQCETLTMLDAIVYELDQISERLYSSYRRLDNFADRAMGPRTTGASNCAATPAPDSVMARISGQITSLHELAWAITSQVERIEQLG